MAQTVSRRPSIGEARIRYQISPREIRGGQGGIGAGFRVLRFVPVSISLRMQHNHSLIYHRR